MSKKKSIFEPRSFYKPFEYPKAYSFYEEHEKMHWLPDEVSLHQDVLDWKNKLTDAEKNFLTQIFRLFTQSDVDVAGAYANKYLPVFNKPEIRMMLLSFAAREAVHIQAYSHLIDTLGMPDTTYKAFMDYSAMRDKHNFFDGLLDNNDQIVKHIAAFSAFTEGMQLFSSFIMLLNFTRFNKMNGMGQIIAWSIKDESCLHKDTEVLTSSGWVNIAKVTKRHSVMQYNCDTGELSYCHPKSIVSSVKSKSYVFQEDDSFYQHVTGDHRMICFGGEVLADAATGKELYVMSGLKHDGDSILTDDDKEKLIEVMLRDRSARWLYNRITTASSQWCVLSLNYISSAIGFGQCDQNLLKLLANIGGGIIIEDKFNAVSYTHVDKREIIHEPMKFYCISVPTGAFVIRHKSAISITGNCHVDGMSWLFKEIIKENREVWTDELKSQLYAIAEKMVELEDQFIDLAFEMGDIEGLTIEEVKTYIRYITDRRLIGLGLRGVYKIKKNPLPWVEELINAPEHTNFFEQRSTAYSKGSMTGSWGSVWKSE